MSLDNGFMSALNEASAKARTENQTYLGNDGFLYCAKCNTRVQTKVEFKGVERVMNCLCKCALEKKEKEKRAHDDMLLRERIKEMRREAFPDRNMYNWTFENDDTPEAAISKTMKNYVKNFNDFMKQGKGLLLYGAVGTGKTYMAACAANALIDERISCLVTSLSRLINQLQNSFSGRQEFIDNLQKHKLLVIDDFGAERNSEYSLEQTFNIIDSRYRTGLPMIITTNLPLEEFKNPKDREHERIFDRILECCFPIEVAGRSRRRKRAAQDYYGLKKILET